MCWKRNWKLCKAEHLHLLQTFTWTSGFLTLCRPSHLFEFGQLWDVCDAGQADVDEAEQFQIRELFCDSLDLSFARATVIQDQLLDLRGEKGQRAVNPAWLKVANRVKEWITVNTISILSSMWEEWHIKLVTVWLCDSSPLLTLNVSCLASRFQHIIFNFCVMVDTVTACCNKKIIKHQRFFEYTVCSCMFNLVELFLSAYFVYAKIKTSL